MGRHSVDAEFIAGLVTGSSAAIPFTAPRALFKPVTALAVVPQHGAVRHHAAHHARVEASWGRRHTLAAVAVTLLGTGSVATVIAGPWTRENAAAPIASNPVAQPNVVAAPVLPEAIPSVAEQPVVEVPGYVQTDSYNSDAAVVPVPELPAVPTVVANPVLTEAPQVIAEPLALEPAPLQAESLEPAPVEAAPSTTRVGNPDGSLLFPGEAPPPADPAQLQQWVGNHLAMKMRWLQGR
ncbi:hypothetical protein [Antrihabitans sp. YC2-6]|uniref:hypothetical protein n=1 Tax=Antrihabitans sp. YC2-6 TaxID=2799498 RepID=UPI0018F329C9|nr:hypothetical protein [Antrihabitans sp. YC2-6]MBJ8346748.1 hypothetical protein [Antrihabitans sp. YC2-6]